MAESWRVLEGHRRPVWAVAWVRAPDGRALLASGAYNREVRIWEALPRARRRAARRRAIVETTSLAWIHPPGRDGGLLLAATNLSGGACAHEPHAVPKVGAAWIMV